MRDAPLRERPMVHLKDGLADGWWFRPPYGGSFYICTAYWWVPRTIPQDMAREPVTDVMNRCGKRWELYVAEPDDPLVFRCVQFARWVPETNERPAPKPPPYPAEPSDLDAYADECVGPLPNLGPGSPDGWRQELDAYLRKRREVLDVLRLAGYG